MSRRAPAVSGRRRWHWLAIVLAALTLGACKMDRETSANGNNNNQICSYVLGVSPPSPRIGDLVTVTAQRLGQCTPYRYTWSLESPQAPPEALAERSGGQAVEFIPQASGTYRVSVSVDDWEDPSPSAASQYIVVTPPGAVTETYILRFTPPATSAAPRQQQSLLVTGGTSLAGQVFALAPGLTVQNQLTGPGGPFAGYVRFSQAGYPLHREAFADASGAVSLSLMAGDTYEVLVVPDGTDVAPARIGSITPSLLSVPGALTWDAGEPVAGVLRDGAGAPATGSRIVLRAGALPSTMGVADAGAGAYVLLARPGDYGLEISPPAGVGLPRAVLPTGSGIAVTAGRTLGLSFQWDPVEERQLQVRVMAGPSGQQVPVPNARVTVTSLWSDRVGALEVTEDGSVVATVAAGGEFRRTLLTDAAGRLPLLSVPSGRYRLVIEPGSPVLGGDYAATVVEDLNLEAGDLFGYDAVLAPRVVLTGMVRRADLTAAAGARVVARSSLGVGTMTETKTGIDGTFALAVVEGARYDVTIIPAPGSGHASQVVAAVVPRGPMTALPSAIVLGRALEVSARVEFSGAPVAGVIVQVFAADTAGAPPVAEAVSDGFGAFRVVIPDPGLAP